MKMPPKNVQTVEERIKAASSQRPAAMGMIEVDSSSWMKSLGKIIQLMQESNTYQLASLNVLRDIQIEQYSQGVAQSDLAAQITALSEMLKTMSENIQKIADALTQQGPGEAASIKMVFTPVKLAVKKK